MAVKRHNVHFDVTAQDSSAGVFATVERNLSGVKAAGGALAMNLTKAFAGVAVAIEGFQHLAAYREILRANAAMDDFAESTGASVGNLSALSRVAKVAGTDFEFVTDSMGRMIKGLKGADEEGQNAAAALEFLGVKAKNADGTFRDQGEVMLEVAKKLATYADSGNKVALVQDLYGKGAQKLLPFLKDLADETDRYATLTSAQAAAAEEAEKNQRRLNLVMEDGRRELVNQYTPALNNFLQRLLAASKATGGLASGMAFMAMRPSEELLGGPQFNIQARLREIDAQMDKHQANVDRSVFVHDPDKTPYQNAMAKAAAERASLQPGVVMSGMSISRLRNERDYLRQVAQDQALALAGPDSLDARDLARGQKSTLDYQSPDKAKGRGDVKSLTPFEQHVLSMRQKSLTEQTGESEFMDTSLAIKAGKYKVLDDATGKVRDLNAAEKQLLLSLAADRDTQRELRAARDEMTKANEESARASDEYYAKLVAEAQAMKDLIEPGRQYLHEKEKLATLVDKGLLTQDEAVAAQRKMLEARTKVDELASSANLATEAGHALGLSFTSAMDRVVLGSERGVRALDLVLAAALDVAKVLYGKFVTQPVAGGIEELIKNMFSGDPYATGSMRESGGMGPGYDAALAAGVGGRNADGNAFLGGRVLAFARGGVVGGPTYFPMSGGRTGLMGERGEEAILPLRRSANGRLGVEASGMGGGGHATVVHQHIAFSANTPAAVRDAVFSAAPAIARMAQAAVQDSRRRGVR